MEFVTLNNGVQMPLEGFGVFQVPDLAECERVVLEALEEGYRLIDTAAVYMNEEAVGRAIAKSGIPRDELFITTKLWLQDTSYDGAKQAFATSLEKLGLDYIDLYLIHQPFGDYYGAWRAMTELYQEGKIKAIGVSNFDSARLIDFCEHVEVIPAVNQVELHPFFAQEEAIEIMKQYGVHPQAWGPLAEGRNGIFTDPDLVAIGNKYGKSAAQVVLRWNTQRGVSILPKSVNKDRIAQNIDIWDFSLTEDEMASVSAKDLGHSEIVDHSNPDFVRYLLGAKIHD